MSKYWKVGNHVDDLSYLVVAPNREMAIHTVEQLTGPQNPAVRKVVELPGKPAGYLVPAGSTGFLEEDPEYEG